MLPLSITVKLMDKWTIGGGWKTVSQSVGRRVTTENVANFDGGACLPLNVRPFVRRPHLLRFAQSDIRFCTMKDPPTFLIQPTATM